MEMYVFFSQVGYLEFFPVCMGQGFSNLMELTHQEVNNSFEWVVTERLAYTKNEFDKTKTLLTTPKKAEIHYSVETYLEYPDEQKKNKMSANFSSKRKKDDVSRLMDNKRICMPRIHKLVQNESVIRLR